MKTNQVPNDAIDYILQSKFPEYKLLYRSKNRCQKSCRLDKSKRDIEAHYFKKGLFEDIITRLFEQNIALENVKRADISGVDEFHVRGAEVSKELANSIDLNGLHVLDIGCGWGGPCRMLADEYDCQTTGIDLSNEFIRVAKKLSELVKKPKLMNLLHHLKTGRLELLSGVYEK